MPYQLIISHNFNHIPAEPLNFQRYFFNEIEHLQHQQGENDCYSFYWKNIGNQSIEGRFSVIIQNKIAYSPLRATFGGIEFNQKILYENLLDFLEESIACLCTCNLKKIIINFYPESYLSKNQNQVLKKCLSKLHFQVEFTEQNYDIQVTNKAFYETVKSPRVKQLLRKSSKNGLIFQEEIHPNFSKIHSFIEHSRKRKNRPMTMTSEQLREHFEKFPKNFQLFSVTHANLMISVAVTIKMNEAILYTFYLADDEKYLKDSPTTFLLSGIYNYCQEQKLRILDMGIATEKGILNEGLAHFKKSMGAKLSEKKTYFLINNDVCIN